MLLQKVGDPRLLDVSISQVDVSPDLKRAKVYFVVPVKANWGKAKKGLEKARGFLRSQLAARMNLRYTPDLVFFHDRQNEKTERLDELFRQIAKDKKVDDDTV